EAGRSGPGDTPIVRYEWDLDGDGSYEQSGTAATATHTYKATGSYHVGLRVTDADGEQDELKALVLVAHDYEISDLGTLAADDSGDSFGTRISHGGVVAVTTGHSGVTDQMPGRFEGGSVQPLDLPAARVVGTAREFDDGR